MKIEKGLLFKMIEHYENNFRFNGEYKGLNSNKSKETVVFGEVPILISCPHGVFHTRSNRMKPPEVYTGALGLLVQNLTNCFLIFANQDDKEDPNMKKKTSYKKKIEKVIKMHHIKYFIDLHGAKAEHIFDVDIGTDNGKTFDKEKIELLKSSFKKFEILDVRENDTFKASKDSTLTYFCYHKLKVPSIQLECHKRLRDPKNNIQAFEQLLNAIVAFIYALNEGDKS